MGVQNERNLVLLGGGGHAIVVAEAAQAAGFALAGFLDDVEKPALTKLAGAGDRLGVLGEKLPADAAVIVALGELRARRQVIIERASAIFARVIHPTAIVSPSAEIGCGTFISAGAIVQGLVRIGEHVICNTGCIVEHECTVGENVHVGPRVVLCGGVRVGADTLVGAGAVVMPMVKIGAGCIIGAGAVVKDDVPDGMTVVGVPARALETHHREH